VDITPLFDGSSGILRKITPPPGAPKRCSSYLVIDITFAVKFKALPSAYVSVLLCVTGKNGKPVNGVPMPAHFGVKIALRRIARSSTAQESSISTRPLPIDSPAIAA
jgi:hypothetical protein